MLQHENSNIEIINPQLWAVRFSLIPMISQIKFEPKFDIPICNVPGQLSHDGIMILNKDFVFYSDMKTVYQSVMRLKNRVLFHKVIEIHKSKINTNTISGIMLNLYKFALLVENERRRITKGG